MRYWDSSALVSLLVAEERTRDRQALLRQDEGVVTWWGSAVECASAVYRLQREGVQGVPGVRRALDRLDRLAHGWNEVPPSDGLQRRAWRLLGLHPLRAADALQLAAALIASEEDPRRLDFVCSDTRLAEAAIREGFAVL